MTRPSAQLPLPFEVAPSYGREDFLVGKPNDVAFAYIERWPRWLAPAALIVGPEGAGKTHLASIFAQTADARMIRADHLTVDEVPVLAQSRALVLEDADRFPAEETALFHLLNLARETGLFVILTARRRPDHWSIETPDLISRLRAVPLLELGEPDETLLAALMVKLFGDRQLGVRPEVLRFAVQRVERSYAAVQRLVALADRESLVEKGQVTRPLIARLLSIADDGGGDEGLE